MKTLLFLLASFFLIPSDRSINSQFLTPKKKVETVSSKAVVYTSYNLSFTLDVNTHTLYVHWDPSGTGSVLLPVRWLEGEPGQVRNLQIDSGPHTEYYYGAVIQPNVIQHYTIGSGMTMFKWDGVNPQCTIICQPGPSTGCPVL